jgi:hypothetical protein
MSPSDPVLHSIFDDWIFSMQRIRQRAKELEFIVGSGDLSRKYMSIANESERLAFLMEHFGKRALDVRTARQELQSKLLSLRMKVKE